MFLSSCTNVYFLFKSINYRMEMYQIDNAINLFHINSAFFADKKHFYRTKSSLFRHLSLTLLS